MLPVSVTEGPLDGADPDGVSTAQTALGAGPLDIDGILATDGIATLDTARRVLITSTGDDTGVIFRVTGTNSDNNPIQESLSGSNASAVYTVSDFLTVTEVYVDGATDGDVEIGTNGVASSRWIVFNYMISPFDMSIAAIVSGTVNYTIEYTYDNVNSNQYSMGGALGNYPAVPSVFAHATLAAKTSSADGFFAYPVAAGRLTINSGATGSDSVTATFITAGINTY